MPVSDLIKLPHRDIKPKKRTVKNPLPSWNLTSPETMDYIKGAHDRAALAKEKKEKKQEIAKNAIKEAAKQERLEKKKKK